MDRTLLHWTDAVDFLAEQPHRDPGEHRDQADHGEGGSEDRHRGVREWPTKASRQETETDRERGQRGGVQRERGQPGNRFVEGRGLEGQEAAKDPAPKMSAQPPTVELRDPTLALG